MRLQPRCGPMPSAPDLLIVGSGVVGLWCAVRAAALGLTTVLVDKAAIGPGASGGGEGASGGGQGASGGFLGALVPHQPARWTAKKAFQLEALLSLEGEVAALQDATGISCGYKRCGRLMPIETPAKLTESQAWQNASRGNWPALSNTGAVISWDLIERAGKPDWLMPEPAPLGYDFETLSARINPRALLEALHARAAANVHIVENCAVQSVLSDAGVTLADNTHLTPGHVIIASGYESFDLLKSLTGRELGRGVKGQAALLKPLHEVPLDQPIVYRGGLYVIRHEIGLVAVGSTSEKSFSEPNAVDGALDDLIARAIKLCPVLRGAALVEAWAGVRPKAASGEPIIGPLPDAAKVIIASGGFKITLGLAHRMADAALGFVTGSKIDIPRAFTVAEHLACTTNVPATPRPN